MGHLIFAAGIIGLLIYLLRTDFEGIGYDADGEGASNGERHDDPSAVDPLTYSPMDRPMYGWGIISEKELYHQRVSVEETWDDFCQDD